MTSTLFKSRCFRVFTLMLGLGVGGMLATVPAYAFGLPFHSAKWYMKHTYWRLGVGELKYAGSSEPVYVDVFKTLGLTPDGKFPGGRSGTRTGNDTSLSGTIGFILPHTGHHLSLEANLAPPLNFKFYTTGSATKSPLPGSGIPGTGSLIGRFKSLPPNFTFVYRPFLHLHIPYTHIKFRPYVGVGMMWLYTYDTNVVNPVLNLVKGSQPKIHFSKPLACVGQAGFDVGLPLNFYLTADAKYIACADVHAKLTGAKIQLGKPGSNAPITSLGTISNMQHFRMWLYQISIGRTFWG